MAIFPHTISEITCNGHGKENPKWNFKEVAGEVEGIKLMGEDGVATVD